MVETAAIEIDGLRRSFGDKLALDGVSLRVAPGEIFGYLGPNGAGKTTTIKVLTGLLKPSSGDVRVHGKSVVDEALAVKAKLGYVPESGAVFEKLTAREFLAFTGQVHGLEDERIAQRSEHWMALFELRAEADRPLGSLSKGTKQKVCWAAALIHEPDVLVLDEPLSGLDVHAVTRVKELLREVAGQGRTVFYSSHLVDIVEKLCTRLGVIRAGRLVSVGTVDEVLASVSASSLEEAMTRLGAAEEPAREAQAGAEP